MWDWAGALPSMPELEEPRLWLARSACLRSRWKYCAGVVGEAMVALVLTGAFLAKFGGDSLEETRRNFNAYQEQVKRF